jgi:hypothetical protein
MLSDSDPWLLPVRGAPATSSGGGDGVPPRHLIERPHAGGAQDDVVSQPQNLRGRNPAISERATGAEGDYAETNPAGLEHR